MTNSRSIASTSKLLAVAVAVVAVLGAARVAEAGRKRVVVLEFEGPRSEKFHDDLVRLIQKTHTVVSSEKWNGTAEQLGAGTRSGRDVKKVARKLKVDAIVEGKIEKRRDEFIIRIKLRAGKSGELVGDSIDTKADGPRIDGRAQKDLKDELVGKIDDIESNHDGAGGDDADDDPPARRATRVAKSDDDDKPVRKPARAEKDDDDDPPAARKTARKPARKGDDDDADDDRSAKRSKFAGRSDDERGSDRVGKAKKPEADDDDKPAPKKTAKAPAKPDKPDRSDDDDKPPAKKPATRPSEADDDDKLPPKKTAKAPAKPDQSDDDDKLPPKKPVGKPGGDDARLAAKDPAKKPAARPSDDDDDKLPPRKPAGKSSAGGDARRAKAKKVATRDDDEAAEAEARLEPLDAAAALSPGERFLDAALGMSVTMRRLSFAYRADLRQKPNGYNGIPAPGALLDITAYPLALGHTRRDVVKDIGLELLYDRVLKLNSKATVSQDGVLTTSSYSTLESRFALTAVYRHALGSSPSALVVLGTLGYHRQQFNILGKVDLPDVKYSMFAPGVGLRYPVSSKLILGADARLLLPLSTGMIQDPDQYGQAKVYGFDLSAGADYMIRPNIFARAAARFEAINFAFAGKGSQSIARDNDPMTQDVSGAQDSYIGGFVTIGYLY
jgi:TolB-like protein